MQFLIGEHEVHEEDVQRQKQDDPDVRQQESLASEQTAQLLDDPAALRALAPPGDCSSVHYVTHERSVRMVERAVQAYQHQQTYGGE